MSSKMMSQGARKDEANEGFGYRYDEEVKTLVKNVGTEFITRNKWCKLFRL